MTTITHTQEGFIIHANHPCLKDHFPGQAIVPGSVILSTLIAWLNTYQQYDFTQIQTFKWLSPLPIDTLCRPQLSPGRGENHYTVALYCDEHCIAKGQVSL